MSTNFLDKAGLSYFWGKLKSWVASSSSGVVHTTGDEDVAGHKTFTNAPNISLSTPIIKFISTDNSTGDIRFQNSSGISKGVLMKNISAGWLKLSNSYNNGNWDDGARLLLDNDGSFRIRAKAGTDSIPLVGTPSGALSWGGADITGDVHKTGAETIAGIKTFSDGISIEVGADIHKAANTGYLRLCGGTGSSYVNGAKLALNGSSYTDGPGNFALFTGDANGYHALVGFASTGALNWDGKDITGDVHKAGAETITGIKTFSADVILDADINLRKAVKTEYLRLCGGTGASYTTGAKLLAYGASHTSAPGNFILVTGGSAAVQFVGKPDGTLTWSGQPIQTSSDERLKTPLSAVPGEVLDAWGDVQWGRFKYLDAVGRKGDAARLHVGLVAQRVQAAFAARGLDALGYGILCHDVQDASENAPAVDMWTVRYTEALSMEAAYQRRRADMLEARIAALEAKA